MQRTDNHFVRAKCQRCKGVVNVGVGYKGERACEKCRKAEAVEKAKRKAA